MAVYGLTPEGFSAKPAVQSKLDFDASFKGVYGASIGSESDGSIPAASSIGQEVQILVDAESSAWEMLGAIVTAVDVDQAVTPQLQQLCALTGTLQEQAQFSSVVETCYGVAGTVLPAGRVVTVTTTGTRFVSQAPATLALITAIWDALTDYELNDLISNDGSVWQVIVAGTSGGASDPVGTGQQVDGSVTWQRVGASTLGVALVDYAAEATGALSAAPLTLVNIATPVTGWTGATNVLAATLGRPIESEPALRARRKLELQGQGGGPADAIRAKILRTLPDVVQCIVFVNDDDVVDADGVPAHGVEVLIQAPAIAPTTDAELALAVWRAVGAGIATGGTTTAVITDASGNPQTVKFSRPVEVPIYAALTVYYLASEWPAGAAAVQAATKSALGTRFVDYQIGDDVRAAVLAAAVLDGPQEVNAAGDPVIPATAGSQKAPGLLGVANGAGTDGTTPYIGTAPGPATSTKVTITLRQLPTLDPANVTVTATAATP